MKIFDKGAFREINKYDKLYELIKKARINASRQTDNKTEDGE